MVLQVHVINENHYVSTTKEPVASKPGRMLTYIDRLLCLTLHEPLITWSFETI